MEKYTLNRAIDREYPMPKVTWNTGSAAGVSLGDYHFPRDLFNQDFIQEKVNDFRFFRAGLRVSVRVTASKFLYGKLMLVYMPYVHQDRFLPKYVTLNTLSGFPHVLVSATASEAAVLDVPFISPFRVLDFRNHNQSEMGVFRLMVVNPLTHISAEVSSAQVVVTAQFINAELMLPHQEFTPTSAEAALKTVTGLITGDKELADTIPAVMDNKTDTPYTSLFKGAVSAGVKSMFGLSKPAFVGTEGKVNLGIAEDLPHGKGMYYGVRNSMDPECQVSTQPVTGGVDTDEMDLKYVIGTPMLHSTVSVNENTSATVVYDPQFTITPKTYLEFIANNFLFSSGSQKIKIYITSSLMHAVRGVFYLSDVATTSWSSCYHMVVDIQGDTEVSFMLPWMEQKVVSKNSGQSNNFRLYFTTLAWSQPTPAVSVPIHFNVYVAGATDYQFVGMKEVGFTVTSNPRADFATPFEPFHPSIKEFFHHGVVSGETYTSVREMVHRKTAYNQITTTQFIDVYSPTGYSHGAFLGIEMFGLLYRFWRGGIRVDMFKNTVNTTMDAILVYPREGDAPFVGTVLGNRFKQVIQVEIPYYNDLIWCGTRNHSAEASRIKVRPKDSGGFSFFMYKAAADDFSYHFLCAFPPGHFVTLATAGSPAMGLNTFQQWT